ncbi:MAG: PAS domain S-box protein [SAR324 cluster bacterium]|nr:PAS domain S-box protein [SAR324 cluster bacterium]
MIIFLLLPKLIVAQTYPMRLYTSDDGLAQNDLYHICQDSQGYLWMATYGGVSRFDGKHFRNFTENDGIGGSIIRYVLEDSSKQIWVAYEEGVARLEGKQFVSYPKNEQWVGHDIIALWNGPQDGLWVVTEMGVNYLKDGVFQKGFPLEGITTSNTYWNVTGDSRGKIILRAPHGFYEWNETQQNFDKKGNFDFTPVSMSYRASDQTLFVIDSKKLYRFHQNQLELLADFSTNEELNGVIHGIGDKIWVYSTQSVWLWSSQSLKHLTASHLHNPSIVHVFEDREEHLWLAQNGGTSMLQTSEIINYRGLPSGRIVSSIIKLADDSLLIGGDQGVSQITPHGEIPSFLPLGYVNYMKVLQNKIWISTEKDIGVYDQTGTPIMNIEDQSLFFLQDRQGKKWDSVFNKGIYSIQEGTRTLEIDTNTGLQNNNIWVMHEDSDGHIWAGHEKGVSVYSQGTWTHFSSKDGLTHDNVWDIVEHSAWGLLIGTGKGISRWKDGKFEALPVLQNEVANSVIVTPDDKLWVGTANGVYRVNTNNDIELYFDKSRGLAGNEVFIHSKWIEGESLYIGTYGGLSRINWKLSPPAIVSPILEITNLEINHQVQPLTSLAQPLSYDKKNLIFSFNAVYTHLPQAVSFQSYLEGLDSGWNEITPINQAVYTNLAPGTYTFHVKALAEDRKESAEQRVTFRILKPFWMKWWFLTLEGALIILLLVGSFHWLNKRSLKKADAEQKRLRAEKEQTDALYQKQLQFDKLKDELLVALRQSEERLLALLNAMPDMMFRINRDGIFLDFHDTSGETFIPPEQIIGTRYVDMPFPPQMKEKLWDTAQRAFETLELQSYEYELPIGDSFYFYEARIVKSGDDEIVCIVRDITTRKKAENELAQTQLQLIQSAKLASIGELATGVAHELNQPLAYLRNMSQLRIQMGLESLSPEQAYETFAEFVEQTDHMRKIINHLRDFSRNSTEIMEPLKLHTVLKSSFTLLNEQFRQRNIEVKLELAESLPEILGNASKIEQVFVNLLSNARDALEGNPQGEVTIQTEFLPQSEGGGLVIIRFRDNGCGIPQAFQNRIFDPFYTTKEVGKGTGLGLSISYGIIKEHHGTISVFSEEGKGTMFELTFPCPEPDSSPDTATV